MREDIEKILISREKLDLRVREMANDIAETYRNSETGLVLVPILAGSIIFLADLIRCLPMRMKIGLITVSSYRGNATTPGEARMLQPLNVDITGRDVLLIDDILDTGNTLKFVRAELEKHEPASVRTCVLLRKPDRAPKDFPVDFVGFDVEDVFVIGYGLDYNNLYRNWPDIAVLKKELYS